MYIYERKQWPHFIWEEDSLTELLIQLRHQQGRLIGGMESIGFYLRDETALQALTQEVVKSSEIEGEIIDQSLVRSSVARKLGMEDAALHQVDRNVEGIVNMMFDATQKFDRPLSKKRLFDWHTGLFPDELSGFKKIKVGAWRSGSVEVISGYMGKETLEEPSPRGHWDSSSVKDFETKLHGSPNPVLKDRDCGLASVHFEAPPADRVSQEMNIFLHWFNHEKKLDPVLKGAIAHFWFVTIHPFDDGNGRIARAIGDLMLARSEKSSRRFYSLSAQIQKERNSYYDILESTQKGGLNITLWIKWLLQCLERAIQEAQLTFESILRKTQFWDSLAQIPLNERQRKIIHRLVDGFNGKLTTSKWAKIAQCSQDTAYRDILDLIDQGILVKNPEGGRSTSYSLVLPKI